jgi:hypothetical protein
MTSELERNSEGGHPDSVTRCPTCGGSKSPDGADKKTYLQALRDGELYGVSYSVDGQAWLSLLFGCVAVFAAVAALIEGTGLMGNMALAWLALVVFSGATLFYARDLWRNRGVSRRRYLPLWHKSRGRVVRTPKRKLF